MSGFNNNNKVDDHIRYDNHSHNYYLKGDMTQFAGYKLNEIVKFTHKFYPDISEENIFLKIPEQIIKDIIYNNFERLVGIPIDDFKKEGYELAFKFTKNSTVRIITVR